MGTRNLTKVIDREGNLRVAQYGQFDGYPSGQGVKMLNFITSEYRILETIEESLAKAYFATNEEIDRLYGEFETTGDGWMTIEEGKKLSLRYPNLARETATDILKVITYSIGLVPLVNQASFEQDELFCEGVFTLDFKEGKFITKYNGDVVECDLNNLPTAEEYLAKWK